LVVFGSLALRKSFSEGNRLLGVLAAFRPHFGAYARGGARCGIARFAVPVASSRVPPLWSWAMSAGSSVGPVVPRPRDCRRTFTHSLHDTDVERRDAPLMVRPWPLPRRLPFDDAARKRFRAVSSPAERSLDP
jgi:hypothetical protein